tara:strand:+ start:892 stop:1002 length:111 start_codon:yes stop_codon:yes gene_type:complete
MKFIIQITNAVVSSGIEHNLEEDKAVVSSIVKAIII